MKKLITIIFLLVTIITNSQSFVQQQDKQLHFAAGAIVSGITYTLVYENTHSKSKAFLWSLISTTSIGILKEVKDQIVYKGWDNKDLGATILGGTFISASYSIIIWDKKKKL